MINTNKLINTQNSGKTLKQLLGNNLTNNVAPEYRSINKVSYNVDPERFQRYMLFQSSSVRFKLRLQRLLISYPFIKTDSNISKDWAYSACQPQLQNYFNYVNKASVFQKYVLQNTRTSILSLTSDQGDLVPVSFYDLVSQKTLFENNVSLLGDTLRQYDNGVLNKTFQGVSRGTQNQVNGDEIFEYVTRDKTYQGQVPSQYKESVNRRGQIFNLIPSIYYSNDFEFQSLLNIFRQNYDKVWMKIKSIKQAKYISYDKGQKLFLGDFVKQQLDNNGINYYDINPRSMGNIVLYNYVPKNINPSNTGYLPINFSYSYLSDQFAYRMFTEKMLLIRSKGSRQPLQRLVNMYGLRSCATGDFSGTGWVDLVDFERFYRIDTLIRRNLDNKYYTDLQATIDDQVFDDLANSSSARTDTTFDDMGSPYGFGSVIDLVQRANGYLRTQGLTDHSLTSISFSDSISSFILRTRSVTGNRFLTFPLYGTTGNDRQFSFSRRFNQIKDIDYILNPYFKTRQQFYPSKNNHIDGLYIKPCIHDLNIIGKKRLSPTGDGLKRDGASITSIGTITADLISHTPKYSDLRFFQRKISSDIRIVPKRKTQIEISNITQLQSQFNVNSTRTTGTKSFVMSMSGYDIGSSTFRFKRRKDDTIGNDNTSNILNLGIFLKQSESKKIVTSTQSIIKISFNSIQDLYSNSFSLDNLTQYNNTKKQFNYIDFYIYSDPNDKSTYITKKDLLQKDFYLPISSKGLLCSIYGWSGFDVQKRQVFEWTLGIDDLSSGDNIKFQFKYYRQ